MRAESLKGLPSVLKSFDAKASRRAIWIDYEGNKNASPTLLGWRIDGHYGAAIIEPLFEICAGRYRAKEPVAMDHPVAISELVERAVTERRHIVSWSTHDLNKAVEVLDRRGRRKLLSVYINALDIARPWHHKTFGCTATGGAKLDYFARLFKVRIPQKYGVQVAGSNLRALRNNFRDCAVYSELTEAQRARWVTIVKHNKWDLCAMESIVQSIEDGIEPLPGRTPPKCV